MGVQISLLRPILNFVLLPFMQTRHEVRFIYPSGDWVNQNYSSIVLRVIRLTVNQEESDSISDAGAIG